MSAARRVLGTVLLTGVLGVGAAAGPAMAAGDKDCKDFATQQQAQTYFTSHGGSPSYNFNRLDANHNGVACENYGYSRSGSGGTTGSGTSSQVPAGGASTGGGSTQGNGSSLVGGGGALLALGALTLGLRRRLRGGASA